MSAQLEGLQEWGCSAPGLRCHSPGISPGKLTSGHSTSATLPRTLRPQRSRSCTISRRTLPCVRRRKRVALSLACLRPRGARGPLTQSKAELLCHSPQAPHSHLLPPSVNSRPSQDVGSRNFAATDCATRDLTMQRAHAVSESPLRALPASRVLCLSHWSLHQRARLKPDCIELKRSNIRAKASDFPGPSESLGRCSWFHVYSFNPPPLQGLEGKEMP